MSFREYINFTHNTQIKPIKISNLLTGKHNLDEQLNDIRRLKGVFQEYLETGYYPFILEGKDSFLEKLLRVIEKTIFEDIANFYKLKTENLPIFKKIISFLSTIQPGKISIHNIASNLNHNDRTISTYLQIMQETGLIQMIHSNAIGNANLRKPDKIFLNNTNLQYALSKETGKDLEIGTIRELMFIQSTLNSNLIPLNAKKGDYQIENNTFEIGGPNKTSKQIKGIENSYLIKDILIQTKKREIPLIFFGFLY